MVEDEPSRADWLAVSAITSCLRCWRFQTSKLALNCSESMCRGWSTDALLQVNLEDMLVGFVASWCADCSMVLLLTRIEGGRMEGGMEGGVHLVLRTSLEIDMRSG